MVNPHGELVAVRRAHHEAMSSIVFESLLECVRKSVKRLSDRRINVLRSRIRLRLSRMTFAATRWRADLSALFALLPIFYPIP